MPMQRARYLIDDTRSENAMIPKDRVLGSSSTSLKNRKVIPAAGQASTRDPVAGPLLPTDSYAGSEVEPKSDSAPDDNTVLYRYRHAHNLDIPPAFTNFRNQKTLCHPGVAQLSPTMARRKDRRRVSKETLAAAVRKDQNAAMVNEHDVIAAFLYSANNQGKSFKMKFEARPNK